MRNDPFRLTSRPPVIGQVRPIWLMPSTSARVSVVHVVVQRQRQRVPPDGKEKPGHRTGSLIVLGDGHAVGRPR